MNRAPDIDKDSEHWEEIRKFVGGANKEPKHPLTQEMERMKQREPKHMADGGPVDGMPALLGDLTPGDTAPMLNVPRGTLPAAMPPIVPSAVPPLAGTLPTVAPAIPSMPSSGAAAPAETPYSDQTSKIMGGVTPEAIQRLMENLNQQSKRGQIGAGLAGIGDSIAAVGGVKGEHMKNAEDLLQKNKELGLKLPGEMAAVGKEGYSLSKELQADSPNSPYSKVKQNAERSFLKTVGFSDDDISHIPASSIDGLRSGALTRDDVRQRIQSDTELKKMGFGLQEKQIEATKEQKGQETQQNAAKAISDRGVVKTIMDAIPGTAGHAAKEVLEKQAAGHSATPAAPTFTPDVMTYAQKHNITPEQAQQVKLKRTGGQ